MAVTTTQNPRISGARYQASDPACDADAFAAATEYELETVARGLYANTAGDVYVDFLGGIDGRTAGTNRRIIMVAGGTFAGMITKIYNTSSATGLILY
jgi:hypothetical protein